MAIEDPFIGIGWSFPPSFDRDLAQVETTTGLEDIRNSLRIILGTALGERVMNPMFGANLDSHVFEAMNTSQLSYVENLVRTAILYHEPRIDADEIAVEPDQPEGRLDIRIGFSVRGSNSRFNMVYPYYLER